MANILEQIVIDKYSSVEALKQTKPLDTFIKELVPTEKDLYLALTRSEHKPEAGFILECKKASPSKGLIRQDFDVKSICQTYDNYAAAISVLTDEKYFQGSYDDLKIVTETVSCPVLNKDFFIDPYQVYLARYYGADAILLMLSVLDDEKYLELAAVAHLYNLAILTEVSNEQERDRAISLGAKLIGINNRNLRDLSTDVSRTFELAPGIPDDRIIISESGIYNNAQVRELAPAVDGFLVGSSIMAEENIDLACRKLIFGNNKVCGLTRIEDARAAADAGARFGGLIFADKSPRFIDSSQAKNIVEAVPELDYVGVFVNHDITQVAAIADSLKLNAVQLHGQETADYIEQLSSKLPKDCQLWQAQPVITQVPEFNAQADHFVLDGKNAGSGQTFDWQTLASTEQALSQALLAGGLSIENINQALEQLTSQELFGLDLNSGVESSPGIKNSAKLNNVFARIRNY